MSVEELRAELFLHFICTFYLHSIRATVILFPRLQTLNESMQTGQCLLHDKHQSKENPVFLL